MRASEEESCGEAIPYTSDSDYRARASGSDPECGSLDVLSVW